MKKSRYIEALLWLMAFVFCFCTGLVIGLDNVKIVENVEYIPVVAEKVVEVEKIVHVPETASEEEKTAPENAVLHVVATAYCCENYPHICNDGDATTTATGTTPTPGRTIAVDPKVIPYGTKVLVDGNVYIAEDCGGGIKGNRIDICFETCAEAKEFGRQEKIIVLLNEEGEK